MLNYFIFFFCFIFFDYDFEKMKEDTLFITVYCIIDVRVCFDY